jgi:hypothetical protein
MKQGVKEMKQEYLNTAGNTIQVIPPPTAQNDVSIMIEDEDSRKKKVRRKKRPIKRTSSNEEATKVSKCCTPLYRDLNVAPLCIEI